MICFPIIFKLKIKKIKSIAIDQKYNVYTFCDNFYGITRLYIQIKPRQNRKVNGKWK